MFGPSQDALKRCPLGQRLTPSHGPLDVSFDIRFLLVFSLVIELLALAEADQDFGDSSLG
jgi:hypothetical protein